MTVTDKDFDGAHQRFISRLPDCPPSTSPREDAVRALPAFSTSDPDTKSWPADAQDPVGFFACGEENSWWFLGVKAVAWALLLLAPILPLEAAVRSVGPIGLTVGNLNQESEFFTSVLPFEWVGCWTNAVGVNDDLYGFHTTEIREAELRLGDEHITLTQHVGNQGAPIPSDSQSNDHWFQHIAIVVHDMDRAYEVLRRHRVKHVSTAPQTLPDWNKNAAGIRAFYFKDPEDHVLEIIWFPPGKGDPKWQRPTEQLFLGIDHTAIVVSDTDRSLAFYGERLGMKIAGASENYGTEQEHLNQVFGARLRITALRADRGPGIEFLEYITPPAGRALPEGAKATDLIFWRTPLEVDRFDELLARCRQEHLQFVSRSVAVEKATGQGANRTVVVRDPDGHALQLMESSPGDLSSR
jgi:catechol 2,3-dioxygenase-like lactoylglutathione lyase family enzyme